MENQDALLVFECLLRDTTFMSTIDEYITNTIFSTKTFDAKNVPQMVLILMTLLTHGNSFINIGKYINNDNDLYRLLEIFQSYIIDRIKENKNLDEFNDSEFKKSYEICARLAILKLKFTGKSVLSCIGK